MATKKLQRSAPILWDLSKNYKSIYMNWGNRLLVTFIVFGSGMSYLVYRAVSTDFELVEKDYYKKELRYQQVIDGTDRANTLSSPVVLQQTDREILLQMPKEMVGLDVKGTAWFYCAYNSKNDIKFNMNLDDEAVQKFDNRRIAPGTYSVKIDWTANGQSYYTEKQLTVLQ